jgi:hypothetical protein
MKLTISILLCSGALYAQTDSLAIKSYETAHVQGVAPKIDGLGNDAAWNQVPWGGGDFRQVNPDAGAPASVQTKFKILYDAKNLYVLFHNLDPEPDKIVKRMSRRDGFEGDWVEMNIDSYYDKRTAFSFTSSVSGVKGDEYVSDNGNNWDASWDPIWYMATSIVADGWMAEVRIPLSQLRFTDKPELTWGFQITRRFFRNGERSVWQYIPPNAPGWVHLFGELKGLKGLRPQKQLEIQPYVLGKVETQKMEEGNPYQTGQSASAAFGLDAKIGLTSDITLDLTVNPDFGQVEADPSQVNLTAFELFFREQRPFFIEGNNTLNFPVNDFGSDNLFYSRRIGRRPQGWVDTDESGEDDVDEYVKSKGQTTILTAAKLTGKNKNGFSWGVLETATLPQYATIDSLGFERRQIIEPATNYLVARAQQDINKGNSLIGGMLTATNRKIDDPRLHFLHSDAYSGGVDFTHNWKERTYYVSGKMLMSHVRGSTEAITATQTSSERFFQRPDNSYKDVDSTRRSLTGTSGTFIIGKRSGNFVFDLGGFWMSPELELNDIGFLAQTDQIRQWAWVGYRILNPRGIFRQQRYNINQSETWDFGGRANARSYNFNGHVEFTNLYALSTGVSYQEFSVSNADLRGGPSFRYPGSYYYWMWASTDQRKQLSVNFNPEWQWSEHNYIRSSYYEVNVNWNLSNAIRLSLSPSLSMSNNKLQYVETAAAVVEDRYIVGTIDQVLFRLSARATIMLTPNLSIQYWGQPFGTTGKYKDFKYVIDGSAEQYTSRFSQYTQAMLTRLDGAINVDENQNGTTDYSFGNPDFNFGQFRSNAVLRWEYIPGSTFFLVWTQERNGLFESDSGRILSRYDFGFSEKPHNIFLLKFTYRFVL